MSNKNSGTFILSPLYELPPLTEQGDNKDLEGHDELDGLATGESFLLHQIVKDKLYIINKTIHYFLTVLSEQRTWREVAEIVAKEANCKPEDLKDILRDFGDKMVKKGVLIPYEMYDKVLGFKDSTEERPRILTIGQKIHGYVIKEELSIRKAAELYIADRPNGLGECVIKIVRESPIWDEKKKNAVVREFCQEFELLRDLSGHPSVCELYDLLDTNTTPMAAMERIGGCSLRAWLKLNPEQITIADKIDILQQVTGALAWVHKNGIFHGDIHLSNFLVDEGKVKVIDFGLGNRAEPETDEIINKGGVYQYIAPECLSTNSFKWLRQKANHTSEVYQLGVLMYYVLYRELPFKAVTWETLANKILHDEAIYSDVDSQGNAIPPAFLAICKRCMSKQPSDRYENAIVLNEAFRNLQKTALDKQVSTI